MTGEEQARFAVALEAVFRATLRDAIAEQIADEEERWRVLAAVVGLLLKRLAQAGGPVVLERVVELVLQPEGKLAS